MFLTRFYLNPIRRETVHLLGSPQRMHAAVLGAFPPDRAATPDGRVLWRVDTPTRHRCVLYIASPGRPSLEQMYEDCGWSQEVSWSTQDYRPFLEHLVTSQRWLFRLTANPVRSSAGGHGTRGHVVPHVTVEHQRQWLLERVERHGFRITSNEHDEEVAITRRERESFARGQGAKRSALTLTRVQYDGVLEVTDPALLRSALTQGIGRAKAYGCGLLTLAQG